MSKLDILIEQTEFLLGTHKEAKDGCTKIFSDLLAVVESRMGTIEQEGDEHDALARVYDLLSAQAQNITGETEEEVDFLTAQLQAFKELKSSTDTVKRDEMVALLFEGVEELENTEEFKKGINEESALARQNLIAIAHDIKDALDEGSAGEVELYLKTILAQHESEDESCCGDCDDCDDDCDCCGEEEEVVTDQKTSGCCSQEKTGCGAECGAEKSCCSKGIDIFSCADATKEKH